MSGRLAAVVVVVCCAAAVPIAQRPSPTEYEVKAAYLLSFGRYVQWPDGARRSAPAFEVCVLGRDPFGSALDAAVTGAVVGGRGAQARRITGAADAGSCHVLYVAGSGAAGLSATLTALMPSDVLTVSDDPQFLDRGGMIQFVTQGDRVRFQVDLRNAQASGLMLSSDLLRVASSVRRERQ